MAADQEEQAFDLKSVKWESSEEFQMRVKINCNPFSSPDTCTAEGRSKTLRTYDLRINARSLNVSATTQEVLQAAGVSGDKNAPVSPTFDCSKATTPTEKLICRKPELASMEREMVSVYKQAIEEAPAEQRSSVSRQHLQWFNQYARTCNAAPSDTEVEECVARYLKNRTEELRTSLANVVSKVYLVGDGVTPPVVIHKVEPPYSDEARNAKVQGNVQIQLVVDEHGLPREIKVTRSLGMGLDEKAIEAVQQWKFRPGMKDGHAVAVEATIQVAFHLL